MAGYMDYFLNQGSPPPAGPQQLPSLQLLPQYQPPAAEGLGRSIRRGIGNAVDGVANAYSGYTQAVDAGAEPIRQFGRGLFDLPAPVRAAPPPVTAPAPTLAAALDDSRFTANTAANGGATIRAFNATDNMSLATADPRAGMLRAQPSQGVPNPGPMPRGRGVSLALLTKLMEATPQREQREQKQLNARDHAYYSEIGRINQQLEALGKNTDPKSIQQIQQLHKRRQSMSDAVMGHERFKYGGGGADDQ